MVLETIILLYILFLVCILLIWMVLLTIVVTYVFVNLNMLGSAVETIPSKEEMIKELIHTKIPIIMGPNGPMMQPNDAKPAANPIVG